MSRLSVPLQLEYCAEPQRSAAAWWLDGDSAQVWLDTVLRWPIDQARCRIVPIAGWQHGTILGALVIPEPGDAAKITDVGPRCVAYGAIGEHLFVPVDARVGISTSRSWPGKLTATSVGSAVRDGELAALFADQFGGQTCVWHPSAGLVQCDLDAHSAPLQFIRFPTPRQTDWSFARPGQVLNGRLWSVLPQSAPNLDDFWAQAKEDIGSQAGAWEKLPQATGEPSWTRIFCQNLAEGLKATGRAIANWFARHGTRQPTTANNLGARPVATNPAPGAGWLNGLKRRVGNYVNRLSEELSQLRHREIERLLRLLDAQPDEGLRFALPMNRLPHRGLAEPGWRLLRRFVDFSLNRLGHVGPADVWSLAPQHRRRLEEKYRELANREIRLGRHRRAAYIFAELLGDLRAAAATLADGGHFREAAALYDQHLRDAFSAAQCLERGNLFLEAAALYQGIGHFEKTGEMFERAERFDLAAAAYQRAVDTYLEQRDLLAAATVLEKRLRRPEDAYQTLVNGWRDAPQARQCLDASFDLLARTANHSQAHRQIVQCAEESHEPSQAAMLANCYAKLARNYPDAHVQKVAADRTRILAGKNLANSDAKLRRTFLEAVQRLVPHDHLLTTDCHRYSQDCERRHRSRTKAAMPLPPNCPCRLVSQVQLPPGDWRTAVRAGDEIFAVGFTNEAQRQVMLARWGGEVLQTQCVKSISPAPQASEAILIPPSLPEERLLLHVVGGQPIMGGGLRMLGIYGAEPVLAGGCAAFDASTRNAGSGSRGILFVLSEQQPGSDIPGEYVVSGYNHLGSQLYWTRALRLDDLEEVERDDRDTESLDSRWPMAVGFTGAWLGFGCRVIGVSSRGAPRHIATLHHPICSLVCQTEPRDPALIATMTQGARFWPRNPEFHHGCELAQDMHDARCAFLGDDRIVLVDDNLLKVFGIRDGRLYLIGQLHQKRCRPRAVVGLADARQFTVLERDGTVTTWELLP